MCFQESVGAASKRSIIGAGQGAKFHP